MNKLLAALALLTFGLAATPVAASAHTPKPGYSATSDTDCSQSGGLGRRVCFDKSASRVYVYTSDVFTASYSSSYAASYAPIPGSFCSPFRSTSAEFSGSGTVNPARCQVTTVNGVVESSVVLTTCCAGSTQIKVSSTAPISLGSDSNYEFVFTN